MNLLIVEDDLSFREALQQIIDECTGISQTTIIGSRDAALAQINSHQFDYAVLDLKIPSTDGELDSEVAHGEAVYEHLKSLAPGTPVCFLTAFGTEDFITDRLNEAHPADIWGSGKPEPMVRMLRKGRVLELKAILQDAAASIQACDGIESNDRANLDSQERRVLRIFARKNNARSLNVRELSGGLSGARVLKAELRDGSGVTRMTCAARLASAVDIRDELSRYHRDVVRLPIGRYTVHNGDVFDGASNRSGVFYTLVPAFTSLLNLVRTNPADALAAVKKIQVAERNWTNGHPQTTTTIAELRRALIKDVDFTAAKEHLDGLDTAKFEALNVLVHITAQHRDLHAENVLVENGTDPILIDFGTVGEAPACLDPLTFELAFLFHPKCKEAVGAWPSLEHARRWADIDAYTAACPFRDLIKFLREWAIESTGGDRALYATTYAIGARQLKFPNTDKQLARTIMESAIAATGST